MSWRRFFGRRRADAELMDEMESYIAEEVAENLARGMTEDEARRQAHIKFGNAGVVRETLWQQNSVSFVESFARDLRYAVRTLLRSPGFSFIAISVMALCIGASVSLFTVVRSVMLRPLPFRDPERLVMVYEHFRDPSGNIEGFNYNPVATADYFDWRGKTHGFEDMAAWRYWQFNLTGEHEELPEIVNACGGSWNLFPMLGVHAAIGRTFAENEDRPDGSAVMLSWNIFERRFGAAPSIVGRQIHLDGKPYTVVGVLPKWFTYPNAKVQLWVPYTSGLTPEVLSHHDYHFSRAIARLRPDVTLASAMSQVEAVQYQLHLANMHAPVAEDVASRMLSDDIAWNVKKPLTILLWAVGCMMLIGCLNVANLLVARSAARQKEIAIRSALGARRGTLIRVQLMESLVVAIAGGAMGVVLSLMATQWLARTWRDLPSAQSVQIDTAVLEFACALVIAAALVAGLLPAIASTGNAAIGALQATSRNPAGSRSRTVLRKTLLMVAIAMTVILLVAAGLLLKSFLRLHTTDLGCATDNVLTMGYGLPTKKYDSPDKVNAFNETLLERVRSMPGVQAAALGLIVPGEGSGGDDVFTILEHPPIAPGAALPDALYRRADPGYFSALQIPLVSGRFFTSHDRAGQPKTIIISHMLAQQYFPGENPLGKHLHVAAEENSDYEIVGIVGDTRYHVGLPDMATMYFPILAGASDRRLTLVVRTISDPLAISVPIQKQIAELDSQLPVTDVLTMQQMIAETLGNARLSASIVLAFAMLSLMLASVGLYGVLSYLTTHRTAEIGIRIALGAQRDQVLRLMLGDGLRPAIYGLALGLATSVGAVHLVQSMLYETRPLDPAIFAAVATTLLAVTALACLIPAWRASRIDPMQALRTE